MRKAARDAVRLADAGRTAAAHRALTRLVRRAPRLGWARFYRAGLAVALGRPLVEPLADLAMLDALTPDELFGVGREFEIAPACRGPRVARRLAALRRAAPRLAWAAVLDAYSRRLDEDWGPCGKAMEAALRLAPRSAPVRALAARVFYANRLPARSVALLESARRLAPSCFWIAAWLGEARRYAGRPREALRLLDEALAREPRYDIAYSWRGGVRRALGFHRDAAADLDLAIRREWEGDGDSASLAWAYHERHLAKRALGAWDGAFADLAAAHRLNARYVFVSGDRRPGAPAPEASLAELDRLIAARPRLAAARAWRGHARACAGRTAEALADLDAALALDPRLALARAWRAGASLDAGGDARAADAELARALRLDPRCADARLLRAKLRLALGRPAAAETDLAAALALDPFNAGAWAERARAAALRGRRAQARAYAARAGELDASRRPR